MNANRKANLWTTGFIAAVVLILVALGTAACGALGIGEGWVAIDPAHLSPAVVEHALPTEVPVPDADPARNYVVIPESDVPPNVDGIPLDGVPEAPSGEDWGVAIGGALGALGPWGALAGAFLAKVLATRRGRQNGAQAVKALVALKPLDAARSVLAADGWAHTDLPTKPG